MVVVIRGYKPLTLRRRVLKAIRTLACAGTLLACAPAMASADLVIGGTSPTTASSSDCTYTVTSPNEIIDASDAELCMQSSNFAVIDNYSGGEAIDLEDLTAPPCAGTVSIRNNYGDIKVDSASTFDLSAAGCSLQLRASGAIGGAGDGTIKVPSLTTYSGGDTNLLSLGNAVGDLSASSISGAVDFTDGEALTLSGLSADTGGDISAGSALAVSGPASTTTGTLELNSTNGGAITQTAAITAPTLMVSNYGTESTILTDGGNAVGALQANVSGYGTIDFADDDGDGLNASVPNSQDLSISNVGNITLGEISAPGDTATITATGGGSISQPAGGGNLGVGTLNLHGSAISLRGSNNSVGLLNATATSGDIAADVYQESNLQLGSIQASGSVTVDSPRTMGSLQPTATIQGTSISLTGDGITAASGNAADLEAPSVSITDLDSSDPWTIVPGEVKAEGAGGVALTGTTNLTVSGGASFDVTPSSTTSMNLTASGTSNTGTLTYRAGGATVTGTTSPPSGTIDGSGLEPVGFSQMATVNILGATPPAVGGGGGTPGGNSGAVPGGPAAVPPVVTPPSAPPNPVPSSTPCTIKLASTRIKLPKLVRGTRRGKATLTAIVTCSQTEHGTLSGSVAVVTKPKHGKARYRDYPLAGFPVNAAAGHPTTVTVDLPPAVVRGIAARTKLSGQFVFGTTSGGGYKALAPNVGAAHLT